ncbi:major tail protein [Soehngenia longivitae]|uniref:major tail protein n=1 Tax=Soehngenia longivitae TaxID=2562294 RepID=UPI003CD0DAC9
MATIGLDKLYYAKITENENGDETYGTPISLAKAISAELSVELAEATLYADDGAAEIIKEFQSGTLTLGIDDIGVTAAGDLTGATIDDNNVLISTGEDGGDPVAVGFRAKKANGKYRYFWLYRVKFGIPATNLTTKGDSITFSTPTIEGTVLRRNKLDGQGRHPWKAEVNEGDEGVTTAIITGWYTQVYEPTFSAVNISITTQPQDASTTVGTGVVLSVTATASSGTLSYQWYSNSINSNVGGTPISGANLASYTTPTTNPAGTYYYYCVVSVGPNSVTSNVAAVTVSE